VQQQRRIDVHPVEIDTSHVRAVVAVRHAVRIQHRHKLEHKLLAQLLRHRIVGLQQVIEHAVEHEAGLRLARVHPGAHKHHLLVRELVRSWHIWLRKQIPGKFKQKIAFNFDFSLQNMQEKLIMMNRESNFVKWKPVFISGF